VPAMERELLEINRQQGVKEGLYLYLLQKREESALSLAATVSNFRVIDPPSVIYPIFPNQPFIYLIAILVGLAMPFTLLYIRNMLNDKVTEIKDIERGTRTPVLGGIARNKTKQFLVVSKDASSPIVEMLRLIRTNLQFATIGRENKVILVTSSMSGEGKSFFSINLAASLVLTGKKVLLLCLDLRKPALLRAVNMSEGPGVTNYLISDRVSIDDIVRPSSVLPNLFVVGSGPVLASPTELMMGPRMAELFAALRASFDHIIIDSAPVGLVADAFTLAPFIDSTIYVIRSNYTPKDRIGIIDKIYRENKLRCPMIVLNDTSTGKNHKYSYGYGYGYNEKKRRKNGEPVLKKVTPANEVASLK
jgi:capsular exopolysaccharide synthesis family protein